MKREEIAEIALNSIQLQERVVKGLRSSLNDDFLDAVEHIYRKADRVIVTGIGKSAIIARKITATLNSTGTSSIFMHASDALHGDLGMINSGDVILCISKSGATSEIKVLINQIKKFGNKVIGMVSHPNSFLAKNSDYVLNIPVVMEADPNNLAPTSSTTAQLVMGDTIAISLLAMRGFSQEHFAMFHPGGSLGNQLYLRVSDLYVHNEKPQVKPEDDMRSVIYEMTSKRLGATAVLDSNKIIGIITDGDLRRALEQNKQVFSLSANQIMTKKPKTIGPQEYAVKALSKMKKKNITQLLVSENDEYLGMIHLHDLLDAGLI